MYALSGIKISNIILDIIGALREGCEAERECSDCGIDDILTFKS